MGWTDRSEYTEPDDAEYDDRPIIGITARQRMRPGDTYTLRFEDNGEEVETQNGETVAFDVEVVETDVPFPTGDDDSVAEGPARLMTDSARFLSKLQEVMPVRDKDVAVTVEGTGYDAEYTVAEA